MRTLKEFFQAGVKVEEAKEVREKARAVLREAAQLHLPNELAALDHASDQLKEAEKEFADVAMSMITDAERSVQRQAMIDHVATCDDPNCAVKKALAAGSASTPNKPVN